MGNSDRYKKCREIRCKLKGNFILSGVKHVQQEKLKRNTVTFLDFPSQHFHHNIMCNRHFVFSPFKLGSPTLPDSKTPLLKDFHRIFERNQLHQTRFRVHCSNHIIRMFMFFAGCSSQHNIFMPYVQFHYLHRQFIKELPITIFIL